MTGTYLIDDINDSSTPADPNALHTPSNFGNTQNVASQVISDVATNFHVYSVNWSPNQITFLVDGVGYYTYKRSVKDSNTWPFDLDQYILLNIAMGGIAGTIDSSFT
jgi:beta-glucanase (GH16 family)